MNVSEIAGFNNLNRYTKLMYRGDSDWTDHFFSHVKKHRSIGRIIFSHVFTFTPLIGQNSFAYELKITSYAAFQ